MHSFSIPYIDVCLASPYLDPRHIDALHSEHDHGVLAYTLGLVTLYAIFACPQLRLLYQSQLESVLASQGLQISGQPVDDYSPGLTGHNWLEIYYKEHWLNQLV